eukprot:Em0016g1021a
MEVIAEDNSLVSTESRTPGQSARKSRRSSGREQKSPATPATHGMKQTDLAELFSSKSQKRKIENGNGSSNGDLNGVKSEGDVGVVEVLATKKVKPEEDDECLMITSEDHPAPQVKEEKEGNKSISGVELIEPLKRCPQCKQYLDDQSLQAFIGDPENAVEEFIALADPKLSVLSGGDMETDADYVPQHKITDFTLSPSSPHPHPPT